MKPCVTTVDVADADMRKDVTIIAVGNLAAFNAGVPPQPRGSRTISGVVFEMTEDGRRLIEGAWVGWEGWFENVVADTRSDAAGRYVLCGLPESPITGLFATKQGFKVDYTAAHAGSDAIVDIELRRQ